MRPLFLCVRIALVTVCIGCLFAIALWRRPNGAPPEFRFAITLAHDIVHQIPPTPVQPITLDIDASRSAPEDVAAKQAVIDAVGAWAALPHLSPVLAQPPDWRLWARLDAAPCLIHVDLTSLSVNALSVYATGGSGNCSVCLINRAPNPLAARVNVRLPRGVYTIERLTFASHGTATEPPDSDTGLAALTGPAARLERLEGRDLTSAAIVVKEGTIGPGQIVFYRFTDQSLALRAALWEARSKLHYLAVQTPGPAHKLMQMLDEGRPNLVQLDAGARTQTRRLQAVHSLLMVTAQAQSLHRDYQMRGTVDAEEGAALMGALERLLDSLAEYSAVLLGLVPQITMEPITVEPGSPPVSATAATQEVAQPPADRFQTVELSLANTGERGVDSVKMGLPSTEMPAGATCEPADSAFFNRLQPGQTVRATFRIRWTGGDSVPGSRCAADISYLAGGGPVHLRPRLW